MATEYVIRVRDITESPKMYKPDFVVHGCNCEHIMGAGLAKVMADKFEADLFELEDPMPGQICFFPMDKNTIGINAYTQFTKGSNAKYPYIIDCLKMINKISKDKFVAFPAIGCGIGGLDWLVVEALIKRYVTAPARVEFVFLTEEEKNKHYEI